jgi:EAL and modified HD-GYP domain-containing signal transduction protein
MMGSALLPVGRVGLEMPRDIAADPDVAGKLSELGEMGYIIVLDDFVMRPESAKLLELAHMVKLDAQSFTDAQLRELTEAIAAHKVKLIGERIESYEQFDRCKAAGLGFFEGYFFICQPKAVAGKGIPSNRLAQVQLIAALQNPGVRPRGAGRGDKPATSASPTASCGGSTPRTSRRRGRSTPSTRRSSSSARGTSAAGRCW